MASTGRKLQGVRQQVRHNLLQFVTVCPSHELVFHPESVQRQAFFVGVKLKGVADVVHRLHHVGLLHAKS